jgi:hypothetical protein
MDAADDDPNVDDDEYDDEIDDEENTFVILEGDIDTLDQVFDDFIQNLSIF